MSKESVKKFIFKNLRKKFTHLASKQMDLKEPHSTTAMSNDKIPIEQAGLQRTIGLSAGVSIIVGMIIGKSIRFS